MSAIRTFEQAMAAIQERSSYDRGFISDPLAGDDAARLGLMRTARVLEILGNPQRQLVVVHVAGSKGKGSTCAFIDSMVRASGRRSGRFLSPHLHTYCERFVVDDRAIDEASFVRLAAEVVDAAAWSEQANPGLGRMTAWELSTAMALLWFAQANCEVAVVEVGIGGTLDATNVVDPAVSVITILDYEHTAILGDTMAEIAANKAGIIKPGKPVMTAVMPPEALTVIERTAAAMRAPWRMADRDWTVSGAAENFAVDGWGWRHDRLRSSLAGQHQVDNAGLAIAAIHTLIDLDLLPAEGVDHYIRLGTGTTELPGRFEVVHTPEGGAFVLDGAHTPAAMNALAATVRERFPGTSVTAIFGMLADKDPDALIAPLAPIVDTWVITAPASPRALSLNELSARLERRSLAFDAKAGVGDAINRLQLAGAGAGTIVLVTGSLGMVAEARVALGLA